MNGSAATPRPTPADTAATTSRQLFELGLALLEASRVPYDPPATQRIQDLLTVSVPPLHSLLGQLSLLDRLSGHVHQPPPAPPPPGGDASEALRLVKAGGEAVARARALADSETLHEGRPEGGPP